MEKDTIQKCVDLHHTKPWIPGYDRTLIAPFRVKTLNQSKWYNGDPIYLHEGLYYFEPSQYFWETHAKVSHSPDGSDCSVKTHTDFLTEEGKKHEFAYMIMLKNGSFYIADKETFEYECHNWKQVWQEK